MNSNPILGATAAGVLFAGVLSHAANNEEKATPAPDKSAYHLFHPTPAEAMRELSTDRPDKTESAYTVDAGHFQIEMDLVSYSHDRDKSGGGDVTVNSWAVAPVNIKAGLLNNVDLQMVLDTYNHVTTKDATATPPRLVQRGFGDITTRVKINVWGNDGGDTALALMPFAKWPVNGAGLGNDSVEAGLIVPLAVSLPSGWGMGVMTEVDLIRDSTTSGYHPEFVNSITFAHDIVGKLGGYIEFWSLTSSEAGTPWVGTLDLGLTYGLSDNIQLDAGVNLGITDSAEDVNPFLGISVRF